MKLSISTIRIFVAQTDSCSALTNLNDVLVLGELVTSLKSNVKLLSGEFGPTDSTVLRYSLAISELSEWIDILVKAYTPNGTPHPE